MAANTFTNVFHCVPVYFNKFSKVGKYFLSNFTKFNKKALLSADTRILDLTYSFASPSSATTYHCLLISECRQLKIANENTNVFQFYNYQLDIKVKEIKCDYSFFFPVEWILLRL